MPVDFQSRTKYLTLALFAQNVQDELERCFHDDPSWRQSAVLLSAASSLKALLNKDSHTPTALAHVFDNYDQLRTLQEGWTEEDKQTALNSLEVLLSVDANRLTTRKEAEVLMHLFEKLELRALWNFDQGENVVPEGIRHLCQPV